MKPLVKAFHVGASEQKANLQDPGLQLPPEYITRSQLNTRSRLARWWFLVDNKFVFQSFFLFTCLQSLTLFIDRVLKKAFGGRVRILIEDDDEALLQSMTAVHEEKDVVSGDLHTSSRTINPVPHSSSTSPFEEGTSVNVPASIPVETTQSASHIASFRIGTADASFSDDDSDSGSEGDGKSRHAKVETAAESVYNFGLVFHHRRPHPHHHHHHRNHVACSYGSLANLSALHTDVSPDYDPNSTADEREHNSSSMASQPLYHSSGKY